ncbi:MAG: tail fiber protein [Gemmatimonadaceae bacterium]|nr:tail fiber protein [Gemmatimonadaceae bacterium]
MKQRLGRIAIPAVAAAALAALLIFGAGLVTETQAKPAADPVPAGARAGQTPFLGEMSLVPYSVVPRGWAVADGRLLPINQNQALFALLGARFGGNGVTTFALPNLKGPTDNVRYIVAIQGIFPTRN